MNPILRAAWLAITIALPGLARAEDPACPAKPMLWQIEGKGLEKPSFLFGTLHVGNRTVTTFHPATVRAFNCAQVVYTEIPMDAASQVAASAAVLRKDGKKLSEAIGKDLTRQIEGELRAIQPQLDIAPLESLKTWTAATVIPVLRFQLTGGKALDALVWDRAVAAGKQTAAIEKPADQLAIFDELSEDEQVILLTETLRQLQEGRKKGVDPIDALVAAYIEGDAAKLEAEVDKQLSDMQEGEHKELGERLLKRLLRDRNLTMAETIAGILAAKPGQSHFFAAGTGHFIGKESIVDLLAAKGYRVTRTTE
ncbi:TraB/GumN family protein [Luteolibacter sp. LG18]|uniref:TraB/GumN family protein n=1 Tax=Luteolibacter sp. LG18 TaxID=2819286 RepID=UPI002B2C7ABE|nr:GumN family protein [Luteolibacter sp. LG18]